MSNQETTMKPIEITKVVVAALLLSPSFAVEAMSTQYNEQINSASELLEFQDEMANTSESSREELISRGIKLKALSDYARSVAIRAGISSGLSQINEQIKLHSRELDAIYNFEPLMINGRVVPPVITESRDIYNQTSDLQIRTSGAIFDIASQARFSSVAPNWRDYLDFPIQSSVYEKYSFTGGTLKPTNGVEKKVWEEATINGWGEGVEHSQIMLEQAFNRLNRDFVGMVKYHTLGMEGKITMPVVNNYKLYDSNSGSRMVLDENLLKIEVLSVFKTPTNAFIGTRAPVEEYTQVNDIVKAVPIKDDIEPAVRLEILDEVQDIQNDAVPQPSADFFKVPSDPLTSDAMQYVDLDNSNLTIERKVTVQGTNSDVTQIYPSNEALVDSNDLSQQVEQATMDSTIAPANNNPAVIDYRNIEPAVVITEPVDVVEQTILDIEANKVRSAVSEAMMQQLVNEQLSNNATVNNIINEGGVVVPVIQEVISYYRQ